jgi:hypothetical protein
VPVLAAAGGIRTRLARLAEAVEWPASQAALRPVTDRDDVPAALDALVDAAVARYAEIAHGSPVMLVHCSPPSRLSDSSPLCEATGTHERRGQRMEAAVWLLQPVVQRHGDELR